MKIKVETKNADKIEALLKDVNCRVTSHTLITFAEVEALACALVKKLGDLGLPKSNRAGATLTHVSGGSVPKAYKYARQVTQVKLEMGKTGVYLIEVGNDTLYASQSVETYYYLSEDQIKQAVAVFRSRECIYSR